MTAVAPDVLQEDFTLLVRPEAMPVHQAMPVWVVVSGVMALLVLTGFWWRRRARFFKSVPTAAEPPDVIALRELAGWQLRLTEAERRETATAVSGTMRRYVEGRFGLKAPKLTTEEFWEEQRSRRAVPPDYESFWVQFLSLSDAVKYAGRLPSVEQLQCFLESAQEHVRMSSPRPPSSNDQATP